MTAYKDSPALASFQTDTFNPDGLIAGSRAIRTETKKLASGTLARGAIVGLVIGTATAAAAAGNTGNGTISAITLGAGVKAGVYRLVCLEPVTNLGTFAVEDPDGVIIGRAIVGAAFSGPIGFTISDGATDFVAGDAILVTVAAGGTNVLRCAAAATDGSATPWGICAIDADASVAEVDVVIYTYGDFAQGACTIGAGLTVAGAKDALRARGIHLISVLAN
jgi:hypothetical protein